MQCVPNAYNVSSATTQYIVRTNIQTPPSFVLLKGWQLEGVCAQGVWVACTMCPPVLLLCHATRVHIAMNSMAFKVRHKTKNDVHYIAAHGRQRLQAGSYAKL